MNYQHIAKKVIDTEIRALTNLQHVIKQESFMQACDLILSSKGNIIFSGVGKSGYIAQKISATFSSIGLPSFFMHPNEAMHGDLGALTTKDLFICLSFSGKSVELLEIIPYLKIKSIPIISITGNAESAVACASNVSLKIKVDAEACPLGLAPTASTTASLVIGDSLAAVAVVARGFTKKDFAASHPGGALGKKLLLKVDDIMHPVASIAITNEDAILTDVLVEISSKGFGSAVIVDDENKVSGVFTDGDLRRSVDANFNLKFTVISDVMTRNPICLDSGSLVSQAVFLIKDSKINTVVVVNAKAEPLGAIHISDILKLGT